MTAFNPNEFVREHLAAGTAEKDIRKELENNHGLPSAVGRMLIEEVKATNPEVLELAGNDSKPCAARRKGLGYGLYLSGSVCASSASPTDWPLPTLSGERYSKNRRSTTLGSWTSRSMVRNRLCS